MAAPAPAPAPAPTYDAYYAHHMTPDPYAAYYAYPDPYAYAAAPPAQPDPAAAYDQSYHTPAAAPAAAAARDPPAQQAPAAAQTRGQTHRHDHKEEDDFTKLLDVKAENDAYVDQHVAHLDCRYLSLVHIKPIDHDPLDVK